MIDRNSFKPFQYLKRERVEIKELGGPVLVRERSAGEALELSRSKEFNPWPVLVKCLLTEAGHRIFQDGDEALVSESISSETMRELLDTITNLSGMGDKSEVPGN